ncbi:MAG TPA: sigma-70 family RNA polymerase sigma factor [Anaerolineae bacterium]|nr:sigma-70 family RNA polymerase sigma factor [Anaerolineae bacterium]
MSQVQQGDQAALSTLYDRYAPIVLGVLTRIIGERPAAEEVLQEVFWRIWDKSASFDASKGKFKSWLFSIARRKAIDAVRRRKVRPQPMKSDSAELMLSMQASETDVSATVEHTLLADTIQTALQILPAEQRLVIEMAYFQGKTRREIAAETNTPLGTIHTRARLALKRLRQSLLTQELGGIL